MKLTINHTNPVQGRFLKGADAAKPIAWGSPRAVKGKAVRWLKAAGDFLCN